MSYKEMQRRLADLEREAKREQQAWVESLSDAELERRVAEIAERDPVGYAAVEAMSFADLERLIEGKMPDAEWQRHLARAQEQTHE